jgi:hypothetical protein
VSGDIVAEQDATPESLGLTEKARRSLGLPPERKPERDKNGELTPAEIARLIFQRQ